MNLLDRLEKRSPAQVARYLCPNIEVQTRCEEMGVIMPYSASSFPLLWAPRGRSYSPPPCPEVGQCSSGPDHRSRRDAISESMIASRRWRSKSFEPIVQGRLNLCRKNYHTLSYHRDPLSSRQSRRTAGDLPMLEHVQANGFGIWPNGLRCHAVQLLKPTFAPEMHVLFSS
jgi:hypothetical protein